MSDNSGDKIEEQIEDQNLEKLSTSKMLQNALLTRIQFLANAFKDITSEGNENVELGTGYLNEAQIAYIDGKFNESEHYLLQAEEIFHIKETGFKTEHLCDNLEQQETERENLMMKNSFLMRTRILTMQLQVITDRITALETPDLNGISEINGFKANAEIEFSTGNFIEALNNLLMAENLYGNIAAILFPKVEAEKKLCYEYLRMKKPKTDCIHSGVTVRGNKEDADACINIAITDIRNGNYDKAKRLLQKSLRIHSSAEAEDLLSQIDNTQYVCSNGGDYENNRKLLQGANGTNLFAEAGSSTSQNVDVDSQNIQFSKENNSARNDRERQGQYDKDEAETYLMVAQNAFKDNNLKRAEHFLLKSEKLCPLDSARELRMQLTAEKSKESDAIEPNNKTSMYINIAEKALVDVDFKKALVFATVANNLSQSVATRSLLRKINDEIVKNDNLLKKKKQEAAECLKFAKIEFDEGNVMNAKLFCLRAQELFPTTQGEEMLRQIREETNWGMCTMS